jgi:hypothetical protein
MWTDDLATEPPPFVVNDAGWIRQAATAYADAPIPYHLPEHCIPENCPECQAQGA